MLSCNAGNLNELFYFQYAVRQHAPSPELVKATVSQRVSFHNPNLLQETLAENNLHFTDFLGVLHRL